MNQRLHARWTGLLLAGWLLLSAGPAAAHKVTVFAWVEGDTIHTESKFSGGKVVKGGVVEVFDSQNKRLLAGTTDDQGQFSFPVPAIDDLKVVMTAGSGHANHWVVRASELDAGSPPPGPPAMQPVAQSAEKAAEPEPVPVSAAPVGGCVGAAQIEEIIQRRLQKELAPLRTQLADDAWGFRDIVAGIGYILGLMGLAAYLHYKKEIRRIRRA